MVDSGSPGSGVPAVFNQIAGATPALLESLKASTGVDIAGMLSGAASRQKTNPASDLDNTRPVGDGSV